jgi:hypothetical protein
MDRFFCWRWEAVDEAGVAFAQSVKGYVHRHDCLRDMTKLTFAF